MLYVYIIIYRIQTFVFGLTKDRSGELTKEEFMTALDVFFNCFNLRFSAAERLSLFAMFDRDGSGTVSYDEFVRGVRGEMNDFRLDWVHKAFSQGP